MNKTKFRKPSLSLSEKKNLEDDFINGADNTPEPTVKEEKIKPLLLRLPESLWKDLKQASFDKETTMTAICLDAIRKKVKK